MNRLSALTLQADMAEGAATLMTTNAGRHHFERLAAQLKAERDREAGPIPADIAAMTDSELLAELRQ